MRNFLIVDRNTEAGGWRGYDGLHRLGVVASRRARLTQKVSGYRGLLFFRWSGCADAYTARWRIVKHSSE